jgi:Hsp33 protein
MASILTRSTAHASRQQVTFKGQGPLGELQAIATSEGTVKGKVQAPKVDPPLNAAGKLNVSSAIGKGFLAVVRNHHLMAQPYTGELTAAPAFHLWGWRCRVGCGDAPLVCRSTGMVPITSGEIAEDLAHYLANSEQQNCALGLGVSVGRDGEVLSAGGFLIQVQVACAAARPGWRQRRWVQYHLCCGLCPHHAQHILSLVPTPPNPHLACTGTALCIRGDAQHARIQHRQLWRCVRAAAGWADRTPDCQPAARQPRGTRAGICTDSQVKALHLTLCWAQMQQQQPDKCVTSVLSCARNMSMQEPYETWHMQLAVSLHCLWLCSFGPCGQESLEGRMKRAVAALGAEEVASIVAQEGKVEVTCE